MSKVNLKTYLKQFEKTSVKLLVGIAGLNVTWIALKDTIAPLLPETWSHVITAVLAAAAVIVAAHPQETVASYDPRQYDLTAKLNEDKPQGN